MIFNEYWKALEKRNPGMVSGTNMTISVDSFKRALGQAYDEGLQSSVDRPSSRSVGKMSGGLDDLFGFGRG